MLTQPTFPEDIGSTLGGSLPPEGSAREIVELPSDPDTIAEIRKLFGFSDGSDTRELLIGSVMEGHDWLNSINSVLNGDGEGAKIESRMRYNRGTKNATTEEMRVILSSAPEKIRQRAYVVDSLIDDVATFCHTVLGRNESFGTLSIPEEDLLLKLPSYQLLLNIMNTRDELPLHIAIDSSKIHANQDKIAKLQGLLILTDSMCKRIIQFSDSQKRDYPKYTRGVEEAIKNQTYDDLDTIITAIGKEMILPFEELVNIGCIDPSMYIFDTSQSPHTVYHLHPNINNVSIRGYTSSLLAQLGIPVTN